jgi:autotransporter-associated beta strand protein
LAVPRVGFDPTRPYSWPAAQWSGTYSGPTDAATLDAATSFDTSGFLNPISGTFGWSFDLADHALSLTYTPTPVPEPGTLALLGFAAAGLAWRRRRAGSAVLILWAAGLLPAAANAQSGTWITSTAGTYNWSQASNWQNGIVADGANNTADFATAGLTGPMTVSLDSARTIGSLVFDNPTNTFGWTVSGSNPLTLSSSASGGPTIAVNNPQITATLSVPLAGSPGLTTTGPGTLALTGTNTYSGGTNVLNGTLQVPTDAGLGTGNVTGATLGTLNFTGTTTTTKSFAMNGGTVSVAAGQTVTFNGSQISGAYLDGAGTFATNAVNGAMFIAVTTTASVTTVSNGPNDQFVHFTNSGSLNVAEGVGAFGSPPTGATFNGFTNQGSGTITIDAPVSPAPAQTGAFVNVSNFQSYGTLIIDPAVIGSNQFTLLTNFGTAPLRFNGGSQTILGKPQPVEPGGFAFVAGIDLNGQNAIVAGGLFVNNGFLVDLSNNGQGSGATIVADYGALVKGGGFYQYDVITQNGGKFQPGNSPGAASFGRFVFGPGGVNNYIFDINDATGTAGSTAGANTPARGWGLVKAVQQSILGTTSQGNFNWTATPVAPLTVNLDTLLIATTDGDDVPGPMADFDPTRPYSWLAAQWSGTYSGPTDATTLDAATSFDTSGFLNPISGTFGWSLDLADQALSLTYTPTPVPEPGSLALLGAASAVGGWAVRRRRVAEKMAATQEKPEFPKQVTRGRETMKSLRRCERM